MNRMKPKYFAFLYLTILLVSCSKDESKIASTAKITRIQINHYPTTNGAIPWDDPIIGSATGPDVKWRIFDSQNVFNGLYIEDVNGDTLVYTQSLPIYLDNPTQQHTVQLWDVDDIDGSDFGSNDDLMKSLTFTPWSSEDDKDRDALIVYDGNTEIILDVEYLYE